MAKKRTKKQAKRRIDRVNIIPDADSPFGQVFPRTQRSLAVLNIIEEAAKSGGKILVELDPLDRLQDEGTTRLMQARNIVTDEGSIIPLAQLADMINDPDIAMNGNGSITRATRRGVSKAQSLGRSLSNAGFALPQKRTRKKSSNDTKLSRAFKQANKQLRLKSGKLRKGKTQSDVAKLAHRLRKRMK